MYSLMRSGVLVLVLSLLLVATACSGESSEEEQELTQKLQELEQEIQHIQEEFASLSVATRQIGEQLDELEGFSSRLVLDPSSVGISRAGFLPDPPAGQVTIQILAKVENDGLPGKFTFHLAPEGADLFTTESVPKGQPVAIGPEIESGITSVEPGKFYKLQVVYRNPEDKEVKFLTHGAIVDPRAALPFVRNRCWCAAVPFLAPPGGTFSRIIEVGVGRDTPPGTKVIVVFSVVHLSQ